MPFPRNSSARSGNVRPFPRQYQHFGPKTRLAACAGYLLLLLLLVRNPIAPLLNPAHFFSLVSPYFNPVPESAFGALTILAILYWALIHNRRIGTSAFTRFHLLQSLILNGTLIVLYGLFSSLVSLLLVIPAIGPMATTLMLGLVVVFRIVVVGLNLYSIVMALLSRSHQLPFAGPQSQRLA
jgi:uncharacterized membrane protein